MALGSPRAGPPAPFVLHHRVTFGETDAGGVVYYPNYLRWFDRSTHELFRSLGVPLKELYETRSIALPVVSVQADFRAALHYDEEIEITSQILELSQRSLKVGHKILRQGKEVASGSEVRGWVHVRDGSFTAEAIPEDLRRKLT